MLFWLYYLVKAARLHRPVVELTERDRRNFLSLFKAIGQGDGVGEVLLEVTSLVRTHHVQPDPVFTTLVCAIVVLEGLGRQLDPTLDLFSVGLPLLVGA
ncbi:hypothetical protein EMIHUDRAFT_241143 [Emiliania huxleyi CCMP1516]|uniref:Uncharacterized protein n=2 Tax=Emiliania huxleyi TaxID=2903 RepID=A0A0D3JD78_EMIH1|nr:hypothetical protein EMIHUDRAFT_241143 [Emiliania huxleyi CCMP1516]EOD21463.1 hypothetical protein EMIHUDRAFT_241143 [Emiliania huxleyi CCMP1516]|eukprot:XP_005773892.1 hypothetical protein EMIHUDRAFT_241143 [Emiliania huxleyi CCMP1516]